MIMPASDIPGGPTMAIFADPSGNHIGPVKSDSMAWDDVLRRWAAGRRGPRATKSPLDTLTAPDFACAARASREN